MKSLYKILARHNAQSLRYLKNYSFYGKQLKKKIKSILPDAKVLVFGSTVKEDYRIDSDIDILVISKMIPLDYFKQAEIKLKIKKVFVSAPLEIHLVSPAEYENWYKKFIKEDFVEI